MASIATRFQIVQAAWPLAAVLALGSAPLPAWAESQSMTPAQAEAYFSKARLRADGSLDGEVMVAVALPNAKGAAARVELWRTWGGGYELVASAPKAGCSDCSGPSRRPNPTKLSFAGGSFSVEYQGGGGGLGFWAWRSTWSWDPALSSMRAVATQRIGADAQGEARHAMVDFIAGERSERLRTEGLVKASSCRAAIARQPRFADLSLKALFDGDLEPDCQEGTETGDPLASGGPPEDGALDNLMRASKAKPGKL